VSGLTAHTVTAELSPAAPAAPGAFQLVDFSSALTATTEQGEVARRFIDATPGFISAAAVVIHLYGEPGGEVVCTEARGVDEEYLDRYERVGRKRDPVLNEALRRGTPVNVQALMGRGRWTSLPVYDDVFSLHDLTDVLVAPLASRSTTVGALHFMRSEAESPFGRRELVAAKSMARVVTRAVLAARQAAERTQERSCLWAAVEFASDAMLIRQDSSDVAYVNSAARRLMAEIRDSETALAEVGGEEGCLTRPVSLVVGQGPAQVRIRTVRAAHDRSILVSVLELVEGAAALSSAGAEVLTRRELEVGELAARGLRVVDIAERLVLSPHTVKQHLKSCYSKLGVHSRIGLAKQLA
jgi:DNA-binding CsgD family transcriptional regulator